MNPVRSLKKYFPQKKPKTKVGFALKTSNKDNRVWTSNGVNPDIFKAYDIRGKYPAEINEEIIIKIISSLISGFKIQNSMPTPCLPAGRGRQVKFKIVIGHDARLSSPKLYHAAIKSIKYKLADIKVIKIGLSTTPMFYFLVNHFKADLGIMITASHNPKEYNGLKIVGKKAIPISGKEILSKM